MRYLLMTFALFLIVCASSAGNERQLLREGNRLFEEGKYLEAEAMYRKSLEIDPDNFRAWHNLGNALHQQGRLEEAAEVYRQLIRQAPSDDARAAGWHNLGNSLLADGNIAESIEAYKEGLRLAPMDEDTRYNLAYAFNLLEEQPPESQDDTCDGDGEGDEEQEQPQNGDNGDDDSESAPEQDQQNGEQDRSPDQRPDNLSPEEAERILEALRQQEQKVQEEINRDQSSEPVRREREW